MMYLAIKLFPLEREPTEYQNLKYTISKVVTSLNIKTSLISQYVTRVSQCEPMVRQQCQYGGREKGWEGGRAKILRMLIEIVFEWSIFDTRNRINFLMVKIFVRFNKL